jgi:hypothetical protein
MTKITIVAILAILLTAMPLVHSQQGFTTIPLAQFADSSDRQWLSHWVPGLPQGGVELGGVQFDIDGSIVWIEGTKQFPVNQPTTQVFLLVNGLDLLQAPQRLSVLGERAAQVALSFSNAVRLSLDFEVGKNVRSYESVSGVSEYVFVTETSEPYVHQVYSGVGSNSYSTAYIDMMTLDVPTQLRQISLVNVEFTSYPHTGSSLFISGLTTSNFKTGIVGYSFGELASPPPPVTSVGGVSIVPILTYRFQLFRIFGVELISVSIVDLASIAVISITAAELYRRLRRK